jgi:hypothetical protein
MPAYVGGVPSGQAVAGTAVRQEQPARNPRLAPARISPATFQGRQMIQRRPATTAPPGIQQGMPRSCLAGPVPGLLVTFMLQKTRNTEVDQGVLQESSHFLHFSALCY